MFGASEVSPPMFKNKFIDFFSRTHWSLVPIVFLPLICFFLWNSGSFGVPFYMILYQFLAGWLVWTFMEYWLHRTLFHWIAPYWWGEGFHFFIHGVHHEWFKDPYRLVMPPAASLTLGACFFVSFWTIEVMFASVIGGAWVWAFFAGVMCGYLVYDLTHYYIHHGRSKDVVMLRLRKHHNMHHHNAAYAKKKYGVSTTLWDHVFRTY